MSFLVGIDRPFEHLRNLNSHCYITLRDASPTAMARHAASMLYHSPVGHVSCFSYSEAVVQAFLMNLNASAGDHARNLEPPYLVNDEQHTS